ncbi:MAG TPA: endonuclease/exonuclease/phosphatase family protein [Chloroflexota bacterium]|nr:endonuclease/exonuclease/phosphatase family protein [Chloroflexota bacterium]
MDAPPAALTVMTYNVGNGLAAPERLVGALRASGADLIGLQELAGPQAVAIREGLAEAYPYQVLHPTGFSGKGLLSRAPILDREQLHLYPSRPDLHVRVAVLGAEVTVVVAHPPPPRVRWRGLVFDPRAMAQIAALGRLAANRRPAVLVGDFNMTARHAVSALLRSGGLLDAFQAAGRGRGGTLPKRTGHSSRVDLLPGWPARGLPGLLPLARVDYIWHTADLLPLECWVGADAGSDHLPVLARLALRA